MEASDGHQTRLCETLDWYRCNVDWWSGLLPDAESLYDDGAAREAPTS